MSLFKKILLGIVAFIVLILITALFVSKEMRAERAIVINKPKTEVYGYVMYLKNQNSYSKWAQMDPAMKKTFRGTDGTVGFVSAWESDKGDVGVGEQEIKNIHQGKQIDYEIRFKKPFASVATSYMTTEAAGANSTKVTWAFESRMLYPMNIMRLFMNMDDMIGSDLETGLKNLKNIMENRSADEQATRGTE
jgi:hypothetical protein